MTNYTWVDNCLINGRDIFTVFQDGRLEIRGPSWDRRKRKGDTPNTDRPRICHLESEEQARRIAELVANMDNRE